MTTTVDALGKEIVIGHLYGYSTSSSGRSSTVVGVACNFTRTGMLTLGDVKRNNFIYGKQYDRTWASDAKKVSISPHMVFPVDMKEVYDSITNDQSA